MKAEHGSVGCILQINGQIFEIIPVNPKVSVLRKVNPNFSKGRNCSISTESSSMGNLNSHNINPSPCNTFTQACTKRRWKILIGWTQGAIDELIDTYGWYTAEMWLYPAIMKATFDTSLRNSNITDIPSIEYVEINIGTFNHSGHIGVDLSRTRVLGRAYRNTYNQDRFVLVTHQDYGTISGIADLPYSDITGQYDSDKDAALLNWETMFYPELTFAHELGHTFGAHHDNVFTGPPNLVDCYRGAIFGNGGIDRTLMATLHSTNSIPSSSSAMIFSDPNNTYEYNGQQVSIGNAGRNNKNVVEYTLCYEGVNPQSVQQEIYARFLNNNDQKDNTIVYPNPVKNFINIENSNNLKSIELISIDGRVIRKIKSSKSINNLEVNYLEKGAYFLKLKYPNLIKTVKFIKQ